MSNRFTLLGFFVFLSMLGVAVLFKQTSQDETLSSPKFDSVVYNNLLEKYQTTFDPVTLNIAIEIAVGNEMDWRLNETHEVGKLNILIVDTEGSRWPGELSMWYEVFRQNAVYNRDLTAIVVDYQLIEYLVNRYYDDLDPQNWGIRQYFVQWIVAHEIGHHKAGHKSAHFTNNRMLAFSGIFNSRRSMEIEADTHLADSIIANESTVLGQQANYLDSYLLTLLEMLEKEQYLAESTIPAPVYRRVLNKLGVVSQYPQYFERTLLLLELLSEASDDEEIKNWVKENQSTFR